MGSAAADRDALGVYGKIPAQGDFVRINASDQAAQALDVWVQEALETLNRMGAAFEVEEQGEGFGSLLKRLFLGTARPFTAFVLDMRRDSLAMRLHRRWRWFFPLLDIHDGDDKPVASIEAQWAWFQRRYTIRDAQGIPLGEIVGPFFKPWTFELTVGNQVIGHIKKKWSGFIKEAFTDADNFEVEFGGEVDPKWKALALAAAVLIDVVHFERAKNG